MTAPVSSLNVSTVNLSDDLTSADQTFGTVDRGAMAAEELQQLLHNFSQIDGVENHTHEPRVKVSCPEGEFSVRLSSGKLYLYQAHDMSLAPAELDIAGLMAVFTGTEADADEAAEIVIESPSAGTKWKGVLAAFVLALGLGLNGWAVYSYFRPQPVWPPAPETRLVTDPGILGQYEIQLPGTYATGSGAGQRAIVITPDNHIVFQLFGAGSPVAVIRESQDTYAIGQREQQIHLITQRFGTVEVQSDGSLFYSGDRYPRQDAAD